MMKKYEKKLNLSHFLSILIFNSSFIHVYVCINVPSSALIALFCLLQNCSQSTSGGCEKIYMGSMGLNVIWYKVDLFAYQGYSGCFSILKHKKKKRRKLKKY